jgi:hypothetical protein
MLLPKLGQGFLANPELAVIGMELKPLVLDTREEERLFSKAALPFPKKVFCHC